MRMPGGTKVMKYERRIRMSVSKTISFDDEVYIKITNLITQDQKFSTVMNNLLKLQLNQKTQATLFDCSICGEPNSSRQFEPCYDCLKKFMEQKLKTQQAMLEKYQERESKKTDPEGEGTQEQTNRLAEDLKNKIKRKKSVIRDWKKSLTKAKNENEEITIKQALRNTEKGLLELEAELAKYGK